MKIYKLFSAAFLSALLMTTACDKDFEEINTNPNEPIVVDAELLLPDLTRLGVNQMYSSFMGGDMGACWSQQWGKVQYNDEARYSPRPTIIEAIWNTFYEDVAADSETMYQLAVAEENAALQGIALTMKAWAFTVLTDCYGDIPYTEALRAAEGLTSPAYDTQDVVYEGIFGMLDAAEDAFAIGEGTLEVTSDLLYGGDVTLWRKFAASLKFRALMRVSDAQGMNVSADLKSLVNSGLLFSSNADEAKLAYLGADPNANPIYENIVFGNRLEWKIGEVMVETLTLNGDPRLPVYAQVNDGGIYRGKPAGYTSLPSDDYGYANVSALGTKYLTATEPGYIMSYSELNFLMAEAAVKGLINGGITAAQTYYQEGIDASLVSNGLAAGDWASNLSTTDDDVALEQIGVQNWIGLYCQGVEAWTEQRRTGYPVLEPAVEGQIKSIPSRYTYPDPESSLNATAYNAAVKKQGRDDLETKLWWNK